MLLVNFGVPGQQIQVQPGLPLLVIPKKMDYRTTFFGGLGVLPTQHEQDI